MQSLGSEKDNIYSQNCYSCTLAKVDLINRKSVFAGIIIISIKLGMFFIFNNQQNN